MARIQARVALGALVGAGLLVAMVPASASASPARVFVYADRFDRGHDRVIIDPQPSTCHNIAAEADRPLVNDTDLIAVVHLEGNCRRGGPEQIVYPHESRTVNFPVDSVEFKF